MVFKKNDFLTVVTKNDCKSTVQFLIYPDKVYTFSEITYRGQLSSSEKNDLVYAGISLFLFPALSLFLSLPLTHSLSLSLSSLSPSLSLSLSLPLSLPLSLSLYHYLLSLSLSLYLSLTLSLSLSLSPLSLSHTHSLSLSLTLSLTLSLSFQSSPWGRIEIGECTLLPFRLSAPAISYRVGEKIIHLKCIHLVGPYVHKVLLKEPKTSKR
jgi:hypothetical protein